MRAALERLSNYENLTRKESHGLMQTIINGETSDAQIVALMMAYRMRFPSAQEILGFRDALMEVCIKPNLDANNAIDIVGTGGDGKNTFNISTASCFVVAGAGYRVIKHGNYGSSSISGSSNTLQSLGYQFSHETDNLQRQLDASNVCFLHAPMFHPALKAVADSRKSFGLRSFFNLLGPLMNPVEPKFQLFGTSSMEISRLYTDIMMQTPRTFCIVHALDGYDEVSLTEAVHIQRNHTKSVYEPRHFGSDYVRAEDISGGANPAKAQAIFLEVLQAKGTKEQQEVVLANAALAIQMMDPTNLTLLDAKQKGLEAILNGKAYDCFQAFVKASNH